MAKIKTADKILNCATRLFARHGYDGTIMDELAATCEVNKASIYYHHRDKATLYENVLTTLFTPITETVCSAVDAEQTPVEKLRTLIQSFARASANNPDFASILMREMASGGANMAVKPRQQMQRILFLLTEILRSGEQQKIFKPANALIIHFMILGTVNLFVSSIPLRSKLPETPQCPDMNNTDIEAAAEQLSTTIIASLLLA
jgi:AcrR family transcriptional regulator